MTAALAGQDVGPYLTAVQVDKAASAEQLRIAGCCGFCARGLLTTAGVD